MAFIRKTLSNKSVITKRAVKGSPAWARLEDAKRTTFGELVDAINTAKDSKLEKPSSINRGEVDLAECYCHDWSIPLHAPHLMENFRIPKYFAGDYLQHMPQGSKYADTWPSLFVGGTGTYSEVHVDAFRSNFWMGLMEGRKRWVFFDEKDMPLLGPQWISPSLDPTFKFTPRDAKQWEYIKANCRPREVELKAGEVLFVPSGCAHYVENLTPTVAISCNYIDKSNRCKAAKELEILGASDPRSLFLAKTLTDKAWVEEADSAISSVIRWCEGGEKKNEVTQTDVKSDQHTPFGCSGVGRDGVTVPWVAFKRREGTLRKRRRDSVGTRNVRFADHDKDDVSQSSKRSKLETNDNTIPPGAETLEAFLKRCKNAKTVNDTDGKGVPRFAAMEEEEEIPRVTENVKDNDSEQEKNLVELALGSQIIRIGRRKRRLLKKPSNSNNPQMRCTFISEGRYNYGYRNPWYADHLGDDVDDADTYEDVVGLGYPKALRALGYPKWRNSSSQ
uniref:JmjC domain-containing protein n=1 Tax=Amorphochlora amoebiformis TaxID=1561963 RepID=A0A7S0CX34_9EUKA|mmetsp:Transcript_15310/g.24235  ORF Transcript_15310/g.24235 Transcript_15310/m.24235 type:complete len:504 (+) Transcript_15310:3-1514(+)